MKVNIRNEPDNWFYIEDVFNTPDLEIIKKYIPEDSLDISGKREHNTSTRSFVNIQSPEELKDVFTKFDEMAMRKFFSDLTRVDCSTGRLRVEIINDNAGAYLEEHIDIKEKLITFQIYVNEGDINWGTTIYSDWDTEYTTVPFVQNTGWLTHKNADIIHGVKEHSVTGKRHSVIINYIDGDWRDTDQLFHLK
tara:strand:+ start:80 stop:658 length:579 start_codon:yes stop_codon:yes gene_type:complete